MVLEAEYEQLGSIVFAIYVTKWVHATMPNKITNLHIWTVVRLRTLVVPSRREDTSKLPARA